MIGRIQIAAELLCASLIFLVVGLYGGLFVLEYDLQEDDLWSDGGFAVGATLPMPEALITACGNGCGRGRDDLPRLEENDQSLGPDQAMHSDIRDSGAGLFSLDDKVLRFAASDGTSPLTNGKQYTVSIMAGAGVASLALAFVALLWFSLSRLYWFRKKPFIPKGMRARHIPALFLIVICIPIILAALLLNFSHWKLDVRLELLLTAAAACLAAGLAGYAAYLIADRRDRQSLTSSFRHWCTIDALLPTGIIVLWCLGIWFRFPGVLDYSDTAGIALWQAGQLVAASGSIQALVYPNAQTGLPYLFAMAFSVFGVSVSTAHTVFSAAVFFATIAGLVVFARQLTGVWLAGLLVVAIGFGSWLGSFEYGYAFTFFRPTFLLGNWGFALCSLVWFAWILHGDRPRWRVTLLVLAGLLSNVHLTYGLVIAGMIVLGDLVALRRGVRWDDLKVLAIGIAGFLVFASPQLLPAVLLLADTVSEVSTVELDSGWVGLMAFRKFFHIYLWESGGAFGDISYLLTLLALLLWNASVYIPRSTIERAWVTLAGAAVLSIVGYISVEVFLVPTIAGLVPSRAMSFVVLAIIVFAAVLPVLSIRKWWRSDEAFYGLHAVTLLLSTIALASLPSAFWGPVPYAVLGTLLLGVAFSAAVERVPRLPRGAAKLIGAALVVLLGASIVTLAMWAPAKYKAEVSRMPAERSPEWNATMHFLRTQTDRSAMVLMPPYPYSVASAQRSFPTDYGQFGWSVYATWLTEHEIELAELLYEINLNGLSKQEVLDYKSDSGGILCMFERGYSDLVSDPDRLLALKQRWQSLRYAVSFQVGIMPDEWACGVPRIQNLAFPVVFQNESYKVYSLE